MEKDMRTVASILSEVLLNATTSEKAYILAEMLDLTNVPTQEKADEAELPFKQHVQFSEEMGREMDPLIEAFCWIPDMLKGIRENNQEIFDCALGVIAECYEEATGDKLQDMMTEVEEFRMLTTKEN